MSDPQPFRFLDLPRELRLLVFDHLPIKVTHRPCIQQVSQRPDPDIKLIWITLPGLQILATSRELKAEAERIFHPRLRAIQDAPIRLIFNPESTKNKMYYAFLERIILGPWKVQEFERQFRVDTARMPNWTSLAALSGKRIALILQSAVVWSTKCRSCIP
ncbi:hypothetical protein IQ06DRAFT_290923 [Phaeosphaeriaceae sp. SRC1lsM3a]|nr:hypothetical protein IQ06DRAFT_290923 [Stagonospora sp. SRC1lsM3a]